MSVAPPTPDEAFKELTRRTGLALRECGFQGSGQNFRRDREVQWQAINIQKSAWRTDRDDPIRFYVNIGLHFPKLTFKRYTPPPASFTKFIATKADQTFRIDELFPDHDFAGLALQGIDGWNLEAFCATFIDMLTSRLAPLLDTMVTPDGLARVLRTVPWLASTGACKFVGAGLAPPKWDPAERAAGLWKQDKDGLWWGPGEC